MKFRKRLEPLQQPRSLDPRHLDSYLHIRLLDELYNGRTLSKVLLRKIKRRLRGEGENLEAAVFYNRIVVFDRPNLHGGGLSWGQDFCRVLLELGIGRCHRLFEYCAGPGYIGYSLFANGFCEELTLADINPDAVAAARRTAQYNQVEDRVHVFCSDGLADIPREEQWDLVVSNPPHFLQRDATDSEIRAIDPGWSVHEKFYSSIREFLRPGGRVVMQENRYGSSTADFEPMIRAGGGRIVAAHLGKSVAGVEDGLYYLVSQW